ncbi:PhzF family phenazine biosynthesis protein, partial [Enterococcus faecalis]|uniref:PhzF family phenazine biosynthesis protein n=1 Tax=Enterococcus faecalis TaxID=1351 RepID=UPI003D6B7BA1
DDDAAHPGPGGGPAADHPGTGGGPTADHPGTGGGPTADYRVRIFTPQTELPFAGHPSVGTAHTLVRLGRAPAGVLRQHCGVGVVEVEVDADGA